MLLSEDELGIFNEFIGERSLVRPPYERLQELGSLFASIENHYHEILLSILQETHQEQMEEIYQRK